MIYTVYVQRAGEAAQAYQVESVDALSACTQVVRDLYTQDIIDKVNRPRIERALAAVQR